MTIKGYNFYIKVEGEWVRANQKLSKTNTFTYTGLSSGMPFEFKATAVDKAGNESEMSVALGVSTLNFIPGVSPMSEQDRNSIDSIFNAALADGMGPGLSVSITGPKGHYTKAYGRTGNRELSIDDHFKICSATKSFTALATLRAVDQGLVELEDTLNQFDNGLYKFSEVQNSNIITIRHMLMMRSGIPDYQGNLGILFTYILNQSAVISSSTILNEIKQTTSSFAPGTGYLYSNSNYALLGMILETLYGKTIQQILNEFCAEMGLLETSWPETPYPPEPYAIGYGGFFAAGEDATHYNLASLFHAAGALTSTIQDLNVFANIMRSGEILSPAMQSLWHEQFCLESMPGQQWGMDATVGYGMGKYKMWKDWYGHGGSGPGYECEVKYNLENGAAIAIFENSQSANNGLQIATTTRIFPQIVHALFPETLIDEEIFDCVLPTDPFVGATSLNNLGWGGISVPISGVSGANGYFTAELNADIFVYVAWDRQPPVTEVLYGNKVMTLCDAPVYHNGNSAFGGIALYRLVTGGTGNQELIQVKGSLYGWVSAFAFSMKNVVAQGSTVSNFGANSVMTQPITVASNSVYVHAFSASDKGGPTYNFDFITGAKSRAKQMSPNPLLAVNTSIHTGTISATTFADNKWASLAMELEISS